MKKARIKLWIILGVEFIAIIAMLCMIYFAGKKVYTVRFELNGGILISGETEQRVTQGQNATAPSVAKSGCYLLKWSKSYKSVTEDMVIEAVWEYETSHGIEYTADEEGKDRNYCEISGSFENIGGALYIGAYHNSQKVLGIKEGAFQDRTRITSVYLLDGILTIEDNVFAGCTNLETVVLPSTLVYLGANAFKDCVNLKTVVVTDTLDGMTPEDAEAYMQENICDLPKSLEYIGDGAFSGCDSLQNVYIPQSVTTMGHGVFDKWVLEIARPSSRFPAAETDESSVEESASSDSVLKGGTTITFGKRLVIYVYVPVKPKGWADDWYTGNPEIVWDYLELSDEDEKLAEKEAQESSEESEEDLDLKDIFDKIKNEKFPILDELEDFSSLKGSIVEFPTISDSAELSESEE